MENKPTTKKPTTKKKPIKKEIVLAINGTVEDVLRASFKKTNKK